MHDLIGRTVPLPFLFSFFGYSGFKRHYFLFMSTRSGLNSHRRWQSGCGSNIPAGATFWLFIYRDRCFYTPTLYSIYVGGHMPLRAISYGQPKPPLRLPPAPKLRNQASIDALDERLRARRAAPATLQAHQARLAMTNLRRLSPDEAARIGYPADEIADYFRQPAAAVDVTTGPRIVRDGNGTHVTIVAGVSLHLPGWATDDEVRALIAGYDQAIQHVDHVLDNVLNHYAPGRAGGDL